MNLNIKELEQKMYSRVLEKRDINKIDKMINGIENKKINKTNFWESIRKFTKNIYSDHSIKRWQCLSEYLYELL